MTSLRKDRERNATVGMADFDYLGSVCNRIDILLLDEKETSPAISGLLRAVVCMRFGWVHYKLFLPFLFW